MLLIAVVGSLSCGGEEEPTNSYSMIWISLDTTRADHLGIYGYDRDTSPFLDELARRGLFFEWAIAPQNTTLPVHVTMFTGYHPVVHQIMYSKTVNQGVRIGSSVATLPQILQETGLATRAWVDGGKMTALHGFDRGFDVYNDDPQPLPEKLSEVLEFIEGLDPYQRSFSFIHTYQMHKPYPAPQPSYSERYTTQAEGSRAEAIEKMNLYDGCIRFTDDQLRWFVEELDRRGVLDSTILMITGDHGESFAEYGTDHIGHGSTNLHQNITRVPWIMLHPEAEYRGRRVTALTGLIDFPNTVLALLGFDEVMPGGGVNVLGVEETESREYYSWTPKSASLYAADYHLVESQVFEDPQSNAFYKFRTDPLESKPLASPYEAEAIRARLAEIRSKLEAKGEELTPTLREFGPVPDPEDKLWEELRALGYIQ